MRTSKNIVLITGGSAGIGFEIAKQLTEKDNHVIIIGRDKKRLDDAAAQLKNVTAIVADVSKEADVNELVNNLITNFPSLNMVINNAGRAIVYKLSATANAFEKAQDEMFTNFFSVIRLNEKLLPLLEKQAESAIVNVSSVVAFVPGSLPTYSASKAALHSYTQSLRITLSRTTPNIKVFELMPPLVNTEFSKEIGGANGVHPSVVADAFVNGLENNEFEIHAGRTADIYKLYLSSPAAALLAMNPEPQKV
jgi:uncharacterized oxidoreductase